MPTRTASGQSTAPTAREAVTGALTSARATLGAAPTLGFIFASSHHDFQEVMRAASEFLPSCELVGSQTAGELTERGLTTGGVSVLLTTLERASFGVAAGKGMRDAPRELARTLTEPFRALQERASRSGWSLSTSVLLMDALAGTGEQVVREVLNSTRLFQQIVGGAAGDDGKFLHTAVGTPQLSGSDAAVAVHVFGSRPWGVGVDHGLTARTKPMLVTRAHGSVIYEIDKKPAFEAYRAYAATRGVELTSENTTPFMIANELGVFFLNELNHVRAPIGVGENGELKLVGEITQGASICILDGEPNAMLAAASRAAEHARTSLEGNRAAGVLLFDCVCRGMILKDGFQREVDAVRRVFPNVPVAGFLTYGEIARFRGKLDGWHNSTAVVVAIPE